MFALQIQLEAQLDRHTDKPATDFLMWTLWACNSILTPGCYCSLCHTWCLSLSCTNVLEQYLKSALAQHSEVHDFMDFVAYCPLTWLIHLLIS